MIGQLPTIRRRMALSIARFLQWVKQSNVGVNVLLSTVGTLFAAYMFLTATGLFHRAFWLLMVFVGSYLMYDNYRTGGD